MFFELFELFLERFYLGCQRVDPLFQRAMDALMGRNQALVPVLSKPQTRFETRLAEIRSR